MKPNSKEPTITVAGKEPAGAPSPPAPCRWNPAKEQIDMLENLYKQGVRTPTAEQIQEITKKLQTFGHIEGKNVFYWFQNHKARQRQKQKQDHLSFFHQYYLHHHLRHPAAAAAVVPMPHHPNVLYGQCYMPQSDIGFYTHYPRMLPPSATTTKRRSPKTTKIRSSAGAGNLAGGNNPVKSKMVNGKNNYSHHQETLDLFPLHPTGILRQKEATENDVNVFASSACTSGPSDRSQDQLVFDFFST
ncbi:hypothetical protein SSX86_022453 [Deinandra increscens subsp. villosa]|uniref:Homeobox domain-containing protein n=1 Tax=Deinandra increscens subsp. villosa TaxID=3103831 RepID=A0AAP0CNY3_9ASTR